LIILFLLGVHRAAALNNAGERVMAIATTSLSNRPSVLRHAPLLALVLALIALALLALGPIGWRAGWWHFGFALLNLMPWAAHFGIAALAVSVLTLLLGWSRIGPRGLSVAILAFAIGALIAHLPWHYGSDPAEGAADTRHPPAFVAVAPLREAGGADRVAYEGEGAKIAEQQRRAYPDIVPLSLALQPTAAFGRALETVQRMGWTIVAADDAAARIEASDRSR
jgi:hypothetical protein